MISKKHTNRRAYNWLVYDIGDRFLQKAADAGAFHGFLYDLGSGESPYREFFEQYADRYIAVDWASSLHDTKADIIADLNKPLPIEDEMADNIVSLSVLEHLCEPQMMLNESFRILKPRGGVILMVPWQWPVHEAPHDYFRYTPYGLKYLFEKAGFVEVVVEAQSGFFSSITMRLTYATRRCVQGPRPLKAVIMSIFLPFWYLGQKLAPLLDRLDPNWAAEATGYCVSARKP